ncbi:hypothetical protein D3C83_113420 [compost metagenome]
MNQSRSYSGCGGTRARSGPIGGGSGSDSPGSAWKRFWNAPSFAAGLSATISG